MQYSLELLPVHMHVMATDVECDQELEDEGVGGIGRGEKAEKTGSGASIQGVKKRNDQL